MTKDQLLTVLESPYNQPEWLQTLRDVFGPGSYYPRPQAIALPANDLADAAFELGSFTTATDQRLVGVYEVTLKPGVRIEGKRVGLRQLLRSVYKLVDGALVVFTGHDGTWRFSYISEIFTYDAAGNRQEEKTDAKRYTYVLGRGVHARTPADRFAKLATKRPAGLSLKDITDAFSVDALTKDFYRELSDWYFWARERVTFPDTSLPHDPADDDDKHREKVAATSTIRLITRLMFVWFIKQKGLVPDGLFDEVEVNKLIKGFQPKINPGLFVRSEPGDSTESTYYKAILQNLFFATLNTEMSDTERRFKKTIQHREKTEFRYQRFFTDEDRFLTLIRDVPFLNGGLFDCLDSSDAKGDRIDCFSDNPKNEPLLAVPDYLFFGEDTIVNLNIAYGDTKHGKQTVRGLLRLLSRYNFTVEENTPIDVEVALDPELLGKVFENLLASFNPETETTARKQTGSFYTPREIVEYMVDESLKAHLNQCLTEKHPGVDHTDQLADLFNYSSTETNFTDAKRQTLVNALYDCKVLDPACGSGAFPLGMLQRMVHLLFKLDPKNEYLVKKAKAVAEKEFGEALTDVPASERQQRIAEIEQQFRENSDDYNRKLVLIEQCLHGVDIQPIAVQITKLRFFISLVVEQEPTNDRDKNRGVRPLPNLETKFVAANTLIGLDRQGGIIRDLRIDKLEAELDSVRHQHFRAKTRKTKKKYRDKDDELRTQIADILRSTGWKASVADQLANWNPYDQNCSADFFDTEWMFNMRKGFNIVIANPPYHQLSKDQNASEQYKSYLKTRYKTSAGRLNTFIFFIHEGFNLMRAGGYLIFVIPNTILTQDYYKDTRQFILENSTIDSIVTYAGLQFENAVVETVTLMLTKLFRKNFFTKILIQDGNNIVKINTKEKLDFLKERNFNFNITEGSVFDKILNRSTPLGRYFEINQAIALKGDKSLSVRNSNPNGEFYKLLDGRNIGKYSINWNGVYLDYDLDRIHSCKRKDIFESTEKLMFRRVSSNLIFTYDNHQYYALNTLIVLNYKDQSGPNIKYALSLLNSSLMNALYKAKYKSTKKVFSEIQARSVGELPLKNIPIDDQPPFIRIVDYILFLKVQALSVDDQIVPAYFEQIIDGLVYELYFEAELHQAGCRFHEHLRQLPDVTAPPSDAEKLALCRRVFAQLYDPGHPVRLALFNLDTVPEVAIIEGKGK